MNKVIKKLRKLNAKLDAAVLKLTSVQEEYNILQSEIEEMIAVEEAKKQKPQ